MPLPRDSDARDYYRSAFQWLDDARFLLRQAARPRASVYLAGYTVECMIKALILSSVPRKMHESLMQEKTLFTHNLEILKALYRTKGGFPLPKSISKDLMEVGSWEPERRYRPGSVKYEEAERFLLAVERITAWADGRL